MASEVQICNLALSNIGDKANVSSISPPDPTVQAGHCSRFYPHARDIVQEQGDWTFCKTRIALASVANPLSASWGFAYSLPNEHLRAIKILYPNAVDESAGQDFVLETNAAGQFELYTNVDDACLVYVKREVDTGRFSAMFVDTLSWLLASYLAGPILKGKVGATQRESAYKVYLVRLPVARATDMNQQQTSAGYAAHQPQWISDR